jgi:hypothetical protein
VYSVLRPSMESVNAIRFENMRIESWHVR